MQIQKKSKVRKIPPQNPEWTHQFNVQFMMFAKNKAQAKIRHETPRRRQSQIMNATRKWVLGLTMQQKQDLYAFYRNRGLLSGLYASDQSSSSEQDEQQKYEVKFIHKPEKETINEKKTRVYISLHNDEYPDIIKNLRRHLLKYAPSSLLIDPQHRLQFIQRAMTVVVDININNLCAHQRLRLMDIVCDLYKQLGSKHELWTQVKQTIIQQEYPHYVDDVQTMSKAKMKTLERTLGASYIKPKHKQIVDDDYQRQKGDKIQVENAEDDTPIGRPCRKYMKLIKQKRRQRQQDEMWEDIHNKHILIYKWIVYLIHKRIDDTEMTIYMSNPHFNDSVIFEDALMYQASNLIITTKHTCKICGQTVSLSVKKRHIQKHPLIQAFFKLANMYTKTNGCIILGDTSQLIVGECIDQLYDNVFKKSMKLLYASTELRLAKPAAIKLFQTHKIIQIWTFNKWGKFRLNEHLEKPDSNQIQKIQKPQKKQSEQIEAQTYQVSEQGVDYFAQDGKQIQCRKRGNQVFVSLKNMNLCYLKVKQQLSKTLCNLTKALKLVNFNIMQATQNSNKAQTRTLVSLLKFLITGQNNLDKQHHLYYCRLFEDVDASTGKYIVSKIKKDLSLSSQKISNFERLFALEIAQKIRSIIIANMFVLHDTIFEATLEQLENGTGFYQKSKKVIQMTEQEVNHVKKQMQFEQYLDNRKNHIFVSKSKK